MSATFDARIARKRESHIWERDADDWYVEERWCSARLFEEEPFEGGVLDPACGMGRIVESARGAGLFAIGSDIADRAPGFMPGLDFLSPAYPAELVAPAIVAGRKPGGGKVDFCWLIWQRGYSGAPRVGWLHRDGEQP